MSYPRSVEDLLGVPQGLATVSAGAGGQECPWVNSVTYGPDLVAMKEFWPQAQTLLKKTSKTG